MANFTEGQDVFYHGKETHIETIHPDGTATIANPEWDLDEEFHCAHNDEEYEVPYWITVKLSELSY